MPPLLALLLTTAFVLFLFLRDVREKPAVTPALWIPVLWVLIIGSRPVSHWLNLATPIEVLGGDPFEGNPLDRTVLLALLLAGFAVLCVRRVSLSTVVSRNAAMTVFLLYCALAVLWSDFPFVAFKHLIKVLGHPIMVLIVLTEPDPRKAMVRLVKRSGYVLIPFSIMLIKYYPHIGRGFDPWTGMAFNRGVSHSKNGLGAVCLLFGFFFVWHLIVTLRREPGLRRNEVLLSLGLLCMIGWLLLRTNSMTALMALVGGVATMLFLGFHFIDRRRVSAYLVAGLVLSLSAEFLFGVSEVLIRALGRDPTLTGRTSLWEKVLATDTNPLFGAGFETFWLTKEALRIQAEYWWHPNQAHNGYLEVYLGLGWVGLLLLAAWLFSVFRVARAALLTDLDFGRFQMGVLAIVLLRNVTEASFNGLSLMFFTLYIIGMNYPRPATLRLQVPTPPLADRRRSHHLRQAER